MLHTHLKGKSIKNLTFLIVNTSPESIPQSVVPSGVLSQIRVERTLVNRYWVEVIPRFVESVPFGILVVIQIPLCALREKNFAAQLVDGHPFPLLRFLRVARVEDHIYSAVARKVKLGISTRSRSLLPVSSLNVIVSHPS